MLEISFVECLHMNSCHAARVHLCTLLCAACGTAPLSVGEISERWIRVVHGLI